MPYAMNLKTEVLYNIKERRKTRTKVVLKNVRLGFKIFLNSTTLKVKFWIKPLFNGSGSMDPKKAWIRAGSNMDLDPRVFGSINLFICLILLFFLNS